jgi:Mg2+/citrate symporter
LNSFFSRAVFSLPVAAQLGEFGKREVMKRSILSPTFWIGLIFCVVAALGIVMAENKRLSILEEQKESRASMVSANPRAQASH